MRFEPLMVEGFSHAEGAIRFMVESNGTVLETSFSRAGSDSRFIRIWYRVAPKQAPEHIGVRSFAVALSHDGGWLYGEEDPECVLDGDVLDRVAGRGFEKLPPEPVENGYVGFRFPHPLDQVAWLLRWSPIQVRLFNPLTGNPGSVLVGIRNGSEIVATVMTDVEDNDPLTNLTSDQVLEMAKANANEPMLYRHSVIDDIHPTRGFDRRPVPEFDAVPCALPSLHRNEVQEQVQRLLS